MKLVDTSVAVDHLRGVEAAVQLLRGEAEIDGSLLASEIVRFELLASVRDSETEALEEFFATLRWVAIGEEVVRGAGRLAREYRRSHSGIDDADYLLAATAFHLDAELLTTNVRHFPMLPGLRPAY